MYTSRKRSARNLVVCALFIAIGVILPLIMGHAIGVPGTVLLPMHIPVLLCGLLCGWSYGLLCGLITPVLSSLLTGMPPIFPVLPAMACELMVYGAIGGLLYRKAKWPIWLALPVAMIAGRLVNGTVMAIITVSSPAAILVTISQAVVTGLPGIIIQLLLIPIVVKALEHAGFFARPERLSTVERSAIAELKSGEASCVLVKNGHIIHQDIGIGVRPLLLLYNSPEGREKLQGAEVFDKVIGKAAAMILILGGVKSVYGQAMSLAGRDTLSAHGIQTQCGELVGVVSNRAGDGICPLEQSVMEIDDPELALQAIEATVAELMAAKAAAADNAPTNPKTALPN